MSDTSIEWTEKTWNPVTGCTKVSAGCTHCYAETFHRRFHVRPFSSVVCHENRLAEPVSWRKPRCVFVNSMSDLFVKQVGAYVVDRNDRLSTEGPGCEPANDTDWPEPAGCGWDDGCRGNIERLDEGYQGAPVRIRLKNRKGNDPSEWPADIRVREFPR